MGRPGEVRLGLAYGALGSRDDPLLRLARRCARRCLPGASAVPRQGCAGHIWLGLLSIFMVAFHAGLRRRADRSRFNAGDPVLGGQFSAASSASVFSTWLPRIMTRHGGDRNHLRADSARHRSSCEPKRGRPWGERLRSPRPGDRPRRGRPRRIPPAPSRAPKPKVKAAAETC